ELLPKARPYRDRREWDVNQHGAFPPAGGGVFPGTPCTAPLAPSTRTGTAGHAGVGARWPGVGRRNSRVWRWRLWRLGVSAWRSFLTWGCGRAQARLEHIVGLGFPGLERLRCEPKEHVAHETGNLGQGGPDPALLVFHRFETLDQAMRVPEHLRRRL